MAMISCFVECCCSENGVGLQREAETGDGVSESPDGIHIPTCSCLEGSVVPILQFGSSTISSIKVVN